MNIWYLLAVVYVAAMVGAVGEGVLVSLNPGWEERWRGRFLAVWPFIVTMLATLNAALASLGLAWLCVRTFGPRPPATLLAAIPALAAATALLTWSALRIDPAGRLAPPAPGFGKPKEPDAYHDLD